MRRTSLRKTAQCSSGTPPARAAWFAAEFSRGVSTFARWMLTRSRRDWHLSGRSSAIVRRSSGGRVRRGGNPGGGERCCWFWAIAAGNLVPEGGGAGGRRL